MFENYLTSALPRQLFIVLIALCSFSAQAIIPKAPALAAKSYVLMDYNSGKIVAQTNPDLPVAPASLTKMMTSYVVSAELAAGNITAEDIVTTAAGTGKEYAEGGVYTMYVQYVLLEDQ